MRDVCSLQSEWGPVFRLLNQLDEGGDHNVQKVVEVCPEYTERIQHSLAHSLTSRIWESACWMKHRSVRPRVQRGWAATESIRCLDEAPKVAEGSARGDMA